jgi:nitroreductase
MAVPTYSTIDSVVLRECIRAAVAAPSVHNTQPWLFRLRGDGIDVLVDRDRQLRTLDPVGREMFLSVGAALFNLRVALRAHGFEPFVEHGGSATDPTRAARIRVIGTAEVTAATRAFADAIPRRHTNRRPFSSRRLPAPVLAALAEAAGAEQAGLVVADDILRDGVLSLTRTAETRQRSDPHYRAEISRWTTPGGVSRRDGVPRDALGPRDHNTALPLRDFAIGRGLPAATVAFEPDPTIMLLMTDDDIETAWLRAGEALQRVLLTATVHGLAATPLSQLTEIPALRKLLADQDTRRVVQTVLRIGYPVTPARPTPRRDIEEVIVGI